MHFLHKNESKFLTESLVSSILKVLHKSKPLKLLFLGKKTILQNLAMKKFSKEC